MLTPWASSNPHKNKENPSSRTLRIFLEALLLYFLLNFLGVFAVLFIYLDGWTVTFFAQTKRFQEGNLAKTLLLKPLTTEME